MNILSLRSKNEQGVVSMLTVIILSILLSLITTAFVRVAVSEERNATNDDLSTRAYYAAQAGFEDTIRNNLSSSNPHAQSQCASSSISASSNIDASYTCAMVSLNVSQQVYGGASGSIPVNNSVIFPINPLSSNGDQFSLNISWQGGGSTVPSSKSLLSSNSWIQAGYPVMLKAELVWYPTSGSLSSANVHTQAYYLMPQGTSDSAPSVDFTSTGGLPANPLIGVKCSFSGQATCGGNINVAGFEDNQVFLVVRPVYSSASQVTVSMNDSTQSGSPTALFAYGQASIDVTGKAGDVYRRVKQNVPFGQYQVTMLNLPDFSLIGGNGICKTSVVGSNSSDYGAGTPCP